MFAERCVLFHLLSLYLQKRLIELILNHEKQTDWMLVTGLKYTSETTVREENTAVALGSGNLPVFATPAMVALMENAAMNAVAQELETGSTTVGGLIETSHLAPSPLGATVRATAELIQIDGRKLTFTVKAFQVEKMIGEGRHVRFIVDKEKFISKLG